MAVGDLSFELEKGEILALIGPNGAGKTTVFNCLSGFLPADDGEIYLEDRQLGGLQPFQICQMGMARTFQIVKPFLTISVLDNVMVGALATGPTKKPRGCRFPCANGWSWPEPWPPNPKYCCWMKSWQD